MDCVAAQQKSLPRRRSILGAPVGARTAYVTYAVIALCVLAFLVQLARPETTEEFLFWPARAWHEPWRALTASFLHSPQLFYGILPLHILFNMLFLWQIGPYLESILGHARFAALYLLSALGGNAMVLLIAQAPAAGQRMPVGSPWNTGVVGASGAVFGLFAALFVLNRHLGRSSQALVPVLVINIMMSFWPGISWQGHLGGLLTGGLVAAAIAGTSSRPRRGWQWPLIAVVLAVVVGLMVVKLSFVPDYYR